MINLLLPVYVSPVGLGGGSAVEYANCISAEKQDPNHHHCLGYDTKPSDGEALVLELWECGIPRHCHYS